MIDTMIEGMSEGKVEDSTKEKRGEDIKVTRIEESKALIQANLAINPNIKDQINTLKLNNLAKRVNISQEIILIKINPTQKVQKILL